MSSLGFRRIKPLMNRILVKKPEIVTKSKGGILLQSGEAETTNFGTVVDVGPGTYDRDGKFREWLVNVGDVVLLPQHSGRKITMAEDAEFHLYKDDDVMGVLTEKIQ